MSTEDTSNPFERADMCPHGTLPDETNCESCEIVRLRKLVKMGEAVVDDFMPNIGNCALQDYGRLNTFLMEARKVPK